jgi:hypothetical protein
MSVDQEPFGIPQGFGVRQPSGALVLLVAAAKSGRGLPQSKTLSRGRKHRKQS